MLPLSPLQWYFGESFLASMRLGSTRCICDCWAAVCAVDGQRAIRPQIKDGNEGRFALTVAIQEGLLELAALLLEEGVQAVTPPGQFTPLHHAVLQRDLPLVDLLLSHGADPDAFGNESGDILRDMHTALHLACRCREPQIVRSLIRGKCSVNLRQAGVQRVSALHLTCLGISQPQRDILKLLVKHGARWEADEISTERSPLWYLTGGRNLRRFLINPFVRLKQENLPLPPTWMVLAAEMALLLLEAGAQDPRIVQDVRVSQLEGILNSPSES